MITNEKPSVGIIPRDFWLKNRISDCIEELKRLEETLINWDVYLKQSLSLANEIKYAAEEWEKYYCDNK